MQQFVIANDGKVWDGKSWTSHWNNAQQFPDVVEIAKAVKKAKIMYYDILKVPPELSTLSLDDVERIISNPKTKKNQLIAIAKERFGISTSNLSRNVDRQPGNCTPYIK